MTGSILFFMWAAFAVSVFAILVLEIADESDSDRDKYWVALIFSLAWPVVLVLGLLMWGLIVWVWEKLNER